MSRPERLGRAVRVLVIPMLDAKARRGSRDRPQTKAEPLETQVIEWLKDFRPDDELRAFVLAPL